jgi:hypothetical protein
LHRLGGRAKRRPASQADDGSDDTTTTTTNGSAAAMNYVFSQNLSRITLYGNALYGDWKFSPLDLGDDNDDGDDDIATTTTPRITKLPLLPPYHSGHEECVGQNSIFCHHERSS